MVQEPSFPKCPLVMQGCFPEPDKDPVIQIASMVTNQGETTPVVRNVMTLDTCAAIIGSEVMSFNTEQELLKVCHRSTFASANAGSCSASCTYSPCLSKSAILQLH